MLSRSNNGRSPPVAGRWELFIFRSALTSHQPLESLPASFRWITDQWQCGVDIYTCRYYLRLLLTDSLDSLSLVVLLTLLSFRCFRSLRSFLAFFISFSSSSGIFSPDSRPKESRINWVWSRISPPSASSLLLLLVVEANAKNPNVAAPRPPAIFSRYLNLICFT